RTAAHDEPAGERPPPAREWRERAPRPDRTPSTARYAPADTAAPPRFDRPTRDAERDASYGARPPRDERPRAHPAPRQHRAPAGMETCRLAVGHAHGVKPGNIVGAIAGETGLDAREIGRIDIHDDHSTVDLPLGM